MKDLDIIIDSKIVIQNCPDEIFDIIKEKLTLQNPKYQDAIKYDRSTYEIDPYLYLYYIDTNCDVHIPRGYGRKLIPILKSRGYNPVYHDKKRSFDEHNFQFKAQLRDYQIQAVNAIIPRPFGVIQAGTGAGKTVIALATIAIRKQPTLILVHTKELLDQWVNQVKNFLGIEAGKIGAGSFDLQTITIGLVQTVKKRLDKIFPFFGYLIVDECHRTPSTTFFDCVSKFDCKYMLGLSATPFRRDRLGLMIYIILGDKIHEVNKNYLYSTGAILKPTINIRNTSFQYDGDPTNEYQKMINFLIHDPDRNEMIVTDVIGEMSKGDETILMVADRVNHLQILAKSLDLQGFSVHILTGKTPEQERKQIVKDLADGKVKILASTSSLIGEGFDCPGLSTLFLCSPIRFSGKLLQIIGRILRPKEDKKPKIFDYQDNFVGVLEHAAKCRNQVYEDECDVVFNI